MEVSTALSVCLSVCLSVSLSVSSLQSYVFLSFGPSEVVFARETAFIRRQGKGGKIDGESP